MSEVVEKLKPLIDALTPGERAEVLEYIHALNDGEGDLSPEEWEAEWANEVNRRIADFESGNTKSVPRRVHGADEREIRVKWHARSSPVAPRTRPTA